MSSALDVWLCLLLAALPGALFVLRIRFPHASKRSEALVLVSAAVLFFSICNLYLKPHRAAPAVAVRSGR